MKRLLIGLLLMCGPSVSAAQWARLPNGEWGYTFNYTPQVQFVCGATAVGVCQGGSNSMTINNGSASAMLTFAGSAGTTVASNVSHRVSLGTFHVAFSGTPFTWPTALDAQQLFAVRYVVTETAPISSTGAFSRRYRPLGGITASQNCCEGDVDFLTLGLSPQPPGLTYGVVAMSNFTFPTFSVGGPADFAVSATVGLIPEPSTWALMVLGLAVVGVVARKRAW